MENVDQISELIQSNFILVLGSDIRVTKFDKAHIANLCTKLKFGLPTKRKRVSVLGLGGIGYTVFDRLRGDKFISTGYDDDELSVHNLNRIPIPFKTMLCSTIQKTSLWYSRKTFNRRVNSLLDLIGYRKDLIIDCRDSLDPNIFFDEIFIKLAYNGSNQISFDWFPNDNIRKTMTITEDRNSYEITPSFYTPPIIINSFLRFAMNFKKLVLKSDKLVGTYSCNINTILHESARTIEWWNEEKINDTEEICQS